MNYYNQFGGSTPPTQIPFRHGASGQYQPTSTGGSSGGMSAGTSMGISAVGQLAMTAMAARHSRSMDKLRYKRQMQQYEYAEKEAGQNRRQNAWVQGQNREQMGQAQASETLAMQIEQMRDKSRVANQALAAGVDNTEAIVRDVERSQLRAEMYMDRGHDAQRAQAMVTAADSSRSQMVNYQPAAPLSSSGAWTQFGIQAIEIGQAAYGEYNVAK